MIEILTTICLLLGGGFMLVSALGVVRFPDIFTRMHAASKASSFGLGWLIMAIAFYFGTWTVILKCIAITIFVFLTVPIGSHMIGRVAYISGGCLWEKSVSDELRGRYDLKKHELR